MKLRTEPTNLNLLLKKVQTYDKSADIELIRRAYDYADKAHEGQTRESGESYIIHPLETARILAELEMDSSTIIAGLLHDVVEDCTVSLEQLEDEFGPEVAGLVDGVTKLSKADFEAMEPTGNKDVDNKKLRQAELKRRAENLRKIFLAMARDVRVMIIKLADRTHNMWTLSALPTERQRKIATETQQIYAPLAHRLGIWQIKWQLEDLAFKTLQPDEYNEIVERVSRTRREREGDLRTVTEIAKKRLEEAGIKATIQGRPKHLYSIYHKIKSQELDFSEIYDLTAIRVIVDTVTDCYHALGVVHETWMPIPGKFSDYIAKPKSNMYQSLHTKVVGPRGEPMEIQIRTWEMHRTADFGIAAHWQYKENKAANTDFDHKLSWLRQQLFDWQSDSKDPNEFLRSVIEDLFTDQVFVFTPKGDVIDLPSGSTPVDFAYRIHSDVGNLCIGAKANGKIVPLSYEFRNGDIVEIMTRANTAPSMDWLAFVKTSHAKSKIKGWFRRLKHAENVTRGRELLEREAVRLGLDPVELLKQENLEKIAKNFNYGSLEDLYATIGYGQLGASAIIGKLRAQEPPKNQITIGRRQTEGKLSILAGGVDEVFIRRSRCCQPLPGDDVVGYVSRGRGMALHRRNCPNAISLASSEPERLTQIEWKRSDSEYYAVDISINVLDRVGLLNDISGIFSESHTNIRSAKIKTNRNKTATINLTIEVADVAELAQITRSVTRISDVLDIRRVSDSPYVKE